MSRFMKGSACNVGQHIFVIWVRQRLVFSKV
jgi:hypothetical protein